MLALLCNQAEAGEAEMLHFRTSPAEAKSLAQLKSRTTKRNYACKDFVAVGGAGPDAISKLKNRFAASNSPQALCPWRLAVNHGASLYASSRSPSVSAARTSTVTHLSNAIWPHMPGPR